MRRISSEMLVAYFAKQLPQDQMVEIDQRSRTDPELAARLWLIEATADYELSDSISTGAAQDRAKSGSYATRAGAFVSTATSAQVAAAIQLTDPDIPAQILTMFNDTLHRLAANWLAQEPPGTVLEPTGLVHEAYLRLLGDKSGSHWKGRALFFGAAAQAMRRILVEKARRKHRHNRGGGIASLTTEDLVALDQALTQLAETDQTAAELIQLRYFGGLTISEAAEILGISSRTAERLWTYARAWLHRQLRDMGQESGSS